MFCSFFPLVSLLWIPVSCVCGVGGPIPVLLFPPLSGVSGGLLLGSGPHVFLAWLCSFFLCLVWWGGLILGFCTLLFLQLVVALISSFVQPVRYLWALLRFFFML